MDHNPFLAYLDRLDTADARALRELFRALAKRTHPDLGSNDAEQFILLQRHYHEAMRVLMERQESAADDAAEAGFRTRAASRPDSPRAAVLSALYRYKAHLPRSRLDARDLPQICLNAFQTAIHAATGYAGRAASALAAYDEQFHRLRSETSRYPDVCVKYSCLISGLSGFFDYQFLPNAFNRRITLSYLSEIGPVTDVDPAASVHMRRNRSAAARSALYRMRAWLEDEIDKPVCNLM